ncbi:MAG TPA: prolipoprotein diacylglyceryl transferase [Candidatus Hydrogenedentes bacterium]|nr:prolipoprotein diacylglyceryl transferase [Candidatus Hydrogenedentota bacterium]
MHPILLEIGPIKLHCYGLMIAIGFLAAIFMVQRDVKKMGLDPKFVSEMGFVALILGIAGTRILYILMYPQEFSWSRPWEWFAVWQGGLVFQGAIPITFLYAYLEMKRRGIPFWKVVDSGIPSLALAQGFGRIGCFLNGCCYGYVSETLPWAVRFPPGRPVFQSQIGLTPMPDGWSHPVHPTQLYSAFLLFAICIILLILRAKWHPFPGFTMPIYLILYGMKRFTVEMFRGDLNPTDLGFGFLSNQQVFAIIMFLLGIWLFFFLRSLNRLPAPEPAPQRTNKKK